MNSWHRQNNCATILDRTDIMNKEEMEQRVARAEQLFMKGFNCAQSVVGAYADLFGYSEQQALQLSAGFGGGIGRLRLTCGAACGMVVLAGMQCGSTEENDREGKSENYRVAQTLLQQFQNTFGSITCADLLQLKKDTPLSYVASERTEEYYKHRPCVNQVVAAARIFGDYLMKHHSTDSTTSKK